jgi:hypothetical protein
MKTRRRIASLGIAVLALAGLSAPVIKAQTALPPIDSWMRHVEAYDTLRVKGWNFAGSGPEDFQAKLVVKFRRDSDPSREVTSTRIITSDNDGQAQGISSGSSFSAPFGVAAGKTRVFTGVSELSTSKTIDQTSVANPTSVRTTAVHGLATGDVVTITGNTSTPVINGKWVVTVVDTTHFTIPVAVTVDGANGTMVSSHLSITGGTAASTDVGRSARCSNCGVTCTTDAPCQGPKFPRGTNWQGMITAVISATEIRVKPIVTATPGATSVFTIDGPLTGDNDGLELGNGYITGVDLNFWQTAPKPGASMFEVELNRKDYNDHEGITLIPKNYLEPSGHLSWPWGRNGYDSAMGHGWTHQNNGGNLNGANPAANVELTYVVPANLHWKVWNCSFVLTTDANVANRTVIVLVDDNVANVSYRFPAAGVQAAGISHVYNVGPGLPSATVTIAGANPVAYQTIPAPIGLELPEGFRVRTSTINRQVGDQFSAFSCHGNTVIVE